VFQRYLSYRVLARTNDKAVAGDFDNCSRDDMKVIHAENSLDLSEERGWPISSNAATRTKPRRRQISAEGRARIAAAQKARRAKVKKG
jgi:hypothetical protein